MKHAPLLGLAGLVFVAGCHHASADPEPVRPALTVVIGTGGVPDRGYAGTLEARQAAQLAFRVGGRVTRRKVSVGDHVRRGQELAVLDSTSRRLAATAAAADLAGATASRDHAALTLDRQHTLLATGTTIGAAVDDARAGRELWGANVDEAAARLDKARQELSFGVLRADFDGIITRLDFEVEQVVAPDAPVGEIIRPGAVDFVFDVPERVARELHPGTAFEVASTDETAAPLAGKVREIGPAADRTTRTRRIRLAVEAVPEGVRLGTTLSAKPASARHASLHVPATAVFDEPGSPAVWIVDQDVVRRRAVVLGPREADDFVVTSGVVKGERVVVAGVHALREGQHVKRSEDVAP